jgi:hypothetical protein
MQRVGTSPFDHLALRAQQDTLASQTRHPFRRPTWAPPLPFSKELSSALENFLILHPNLEIFDSSYGRLWAQWANPKHASGEIAGFDLRAGKETNGVILVKIRVAQATGWWIGPNWLQPDRVKPWEQREARIRKRCQNFVANIADIVDRTLVRERAIFDKEIARFDDRNKSYLLREKLRQLRLSVILAFAEAPEAAIESGARRAGVCRSCYHPLKDPTSIELGIGPECRGFAS